MRSLVFDINQHTFVICAYKESPYLVECIKSLQEQSLDSHLVLATSTPNDHIHTLCKQYGIEMHVNACANQGIAGDWNFALSCAQTPLVTLAHQDDVYLPNYTHDMLKYINACEDPLLYFCNYYELRGGQAVTHNTLLAIKRLLLSPLRNKALARRRYIKRRVLSLGNPICCPSCTFVCPKLEFPLFEKGFGSNLDWQTWEKLSRQSGSFVYNPQALMMHRIHEGSETSRLIENNARKQEDLEMLKRFWPAPIARLINTVYSEGQVSNANCNTSAAADAKRRA